MPFIDSKITVPVTEENALADHCKLFLSFSVICVQ